jgi:thiamine biosynthesis protein ThiS
MENELEIRCNGLSHVMENGSTISTLLAFKKIDPACVVVELNENIIPKEAFGSTVLRANDCVEILHFVGGG